MFTYKLFTPYTAQGEGCKLLKVKVGGCLLINQLTVSPDGCILLMVKFDGHIEKAIKSS